MKISIVVAMTPAGLIGKDGGLPWHVPEDLKHFRRVTMGHAVVMGRKTFDEIRKPLKGRRNIVVTRTLPAAEDPRRVEGVEWFTSLDAAFAAAAAGGEAECMLIGGASIYKEALNRGMVDRMYVTWVELAVPPEGDTWFPAWQVGDWREVESREETVAAGRLRFVTYERP